MGQNDPSAGNAAPGRPRLLARRDVLAGIILGMMLAAVILVIDHYREEAILRELGRRRATGVGLEKWNQQMEFFRRTKRRNPASAQELQEFTRAYCEEKNIPYEHFSLDGWGNPFRLRLEVSEECLLEVQSPGPDGKFGEEDRSISYRRSYYYPLTYKNYSVYE